MTDCTEPQLPAPGHAMRRTQDFRDLMAEIYGDPFCFEDGEMDSPLGPVTKLCIGRRDGKPMTWREIWEVFAAWFPGRWAFEVFPPEAELIDRVSNYHLWMPEDPWVLEAFNLRGQFHGRPLRKVGVSKEASPDV